LHGFGGSGAQIEQHTDFPAFAEKKRIAWIAPDGTLDRSGRRFWNAGSSCCNFDGVEVDHVGAIRALLDRAIARDGIDPARVFVVGFSNGGFMAHRLGCELRERVRGIVSVAGAGPSTPPTCSAGSALRVLEIHGDADRVVSYEGGHLFGKPTYPEHISAEKTIRAWAAALGCAAKPRAAAPLDFEATIPGKETKVERFEGCRGGNVELWTVRAGTHYVSFRSPAPEAIWQFLNR
jgi:polyhydroxybutyrate depolymerase